MSEGSPPPAQQPRRLKLRVGRGDPADALFRQVRALHQLGRDAEAKADCAKLLAASPASPAACHLMGVIEHGLGNAEAAVDWIRRSLRRQPGDANAECNLGLALKSLGRIDDAMAAYRRAIALKPDLAIAHSNLANLLRERGEAEAAVAAYREAVRADPQATVAHLNLAGLLRVRGQLDEALTVARRAVELGPRQAEAWSNLGLILSDKRASEEAVRAHRRAAELKPDDPVILGNLADGLNDIGAVGEAAETAERAIAIDPGQVAALITLGNALKEQGRAAEACEAFARAATLSPATVSAGSNRVFTMNYQAGVSAAELFEAHRAWATAHAAGLAPDRTSFDNPPDPDRRLTVGYVSPDFRAHSVAHFAEPLLTAHDRQALRIVCYAQVANPDNWTGVFRTLADDWRSTVGVGDDEVVRQIRRDGVDILVDLAGHTANNRLLVFARRAAPVQVTWLGYPNTTGLEAVDYRLTDAVADPPGDADTLHTEALYRLPGFLCYLRPRHTPPVAVRGGDGPVVFGSFNALAKITPELVAVWARILRRVPGSRLVLKSRPLADAGTRERFRRLFAGHGIAAERLDLAGRTPTRGGHLGAYGAVDIALDPFPYNGTTTTCEALWMGVPVVTLAGDRHAARVGASILTRIGVRELIARDVDGYVDLAVVLAQDALRRRALRMGLRARVAASPLCDAEGFARTVEAAYRDMWRGWCAGRRPAGAPLA